MDHQKQWNTAVIYKYFDWFTKLKVIWDLV